MTKQTPEKLKPFRKTYAGKRKGKETSTSEPTADEPSPKVQKKTPVSSKRKSLENPKASNPKKKGKEVERSFSSSSFSLSSSGSESSEEEEQTSSLIVLQEQLMKWFVNEKQAMVFSDKYIGKTVKPLKYLNFAELKTTKLDCFQRLEDQGLKSFLEFKGEVYPDLVKVFYCNLTFSKNLLKTNVKGTVIRIPIYHFVEIFGLNNKSDNLVDEKPELNKVVAYEFFNSMMREGQANRSGKQVLTTGPLTADNRVLHYVLTYALFPRGSNHAVVTDGDIAPLYFIKNGIKTEWAEEICNHMIRCRTYSSLPYGIQISHLLKLFKVDLAGEVSFKSKPHNALIDKQYLQTKLNLHWDTEIKAYNFVPGTLKNTEARTRVSNKKPEVSQSVTVDLTQVLEKLDQQDKKIEQLTDQVKVLKNDLEEEKKKNDGHQVVLIKRIDMIGNLLYSYINSYEANHKADLLILNPNIPQQDKLAAAIAADEAKAKLAQAKAVVSKPKSGQASTAQVKSPASTPPSGSKPIFPPSQIPKPSSKVTGKEPADKPKPSTIPKSVPSKPVFSSSSSHTIRPPIRNLDDLLPVLSVVPLSSAPPATTSSAVSDPEATKVVLDVLADVATHEAEKQGKADQ